MDQYDVKRLALVLAVQAEIEGLKIANQNAGIAVYNKSFFDTLAARLQELAYAHNEQL